MKTASLGLQQARAQLPQVASRADEGESTVITRHGRAVAVVVPVAEWQAIQRRRNRRPGALLSLRGSGQGLWPQGPVRAVQKLRDEWDR